MAKHVSVIFERRGDELTLIIEDDGDGFDPDDQRVRLKGIGLVGIKERSTAIGGKLEVESKPGRGTTLFVRIPMCPPPRRIFAERGRFDPEITGTRVAANY